MNAENEKADERANAHRPNDLPGQEQIADSMSLSPRSVKRSRLDEMLAATIEGALREAGGNKSRAAELVGVDRRTLYRQIERLGIEVSDIEPPQDPWLTLGKLKDDLRQIVAELASPKRGSEVRAYGHACRALERIGGGGE